MGPVSDHGINAPLIGWGSVWWDWRDSNPHWTEFKSVASSVGLQSRASLTAASRWCLTSDSNRDWPGFEAGSSTCWDSQAHSRFPVRQGGNPSGLLLDGEVSALPSVPSQVVSLIAICWSGLCTFGPFSSSDEIGFGHKNRPCRVAGLSVLVVVGTTVTTLLETYTESSGLSSVYRTLVCRSLCGV